MRIYVLRECKKKHCGESCCVSVGCYQCVFGVFLSHVLAAGGAIGARDVIMKLPTVTGYGSDDGDAGAKRDVISGAEIRRRPHHTYVEWKTLGKFSQNVHNCDRRTTVVSLIDGLMLVRSLFDWNQRCRIIKGQTKGQSYMSYVGLDKFPEFVLIEKPRFQKKYIENLHKIYLPRWVSHIEIIVQSI